MSVSSEYPSVENLLRAVSLTAQAATTRADVAHPEDVMAQVCVAVETIEEFIQALGAVGLAIRERL